MIKLRVAVVLTALLAALVGVQAPAQAAWADCPTGSGNLCWYNLGDGGGAYYAMDATGYPNGTCKTLPAGYKNWAGSIWNKAEGTSIDIYTGSSCTGTLVTILNYGWRVTYGAFTSSNNNTESAKIWHM